MSTRLLLVALLLFSTLAWAWVTRDAFEAGGGRFRTSSAGPSDRGAPPPTGAPTEVLRVELDGEADGLRALTGSGGGGPTLLVQSGHRLEARTPGRRPSATSATWELPPTCYLWGIDDRPGSQQVLSLGPGSIQGMSLSTGAPTAGDPRALAEAGSLFRGRPTRPPLLRRFSVAGEDGLHFIAPDLRELRWMRWAPGAERAELLCRVPTAALAEQVLGYGLADAMIGRLTVPYFHLDTGVDGPELLLRRGDRLLRCDATGRETDLGRAPSGGDREILGFDHAVPPLCADWDRDGHLDVLFTVPAEGTVLAYASARRDATPLDSRGEKGPDQALRVSGWVLHRWLLDADGDGLDDLFLLETPKLNFLGQLGVLRGAPMIGSLTLRRQGEDGSFTPQPAWVETFELPVVLSLMRKVRRIHFPRPVCPLMDPREGLLLLIPSADGVILGRRTGSSLEVLHTLPEIPEGSVVEQAFEPVFAQLDGFAGHDLAWIEQPPGEALPRVVVHRLP